MFHRTPEKYKYQTANIIQGLAELPFVVRGRVEGWVIPGGRIITNKAKAMEYASRMNDFMASNMRRFKRKRL
ncbi:MULTISPECIES: DUF1317 family protein [Acinetobacter]|uniref:DUF1317 family protein n=1 Tax=Acinetobacter baumannii TaxID=470 RepID=A0ABD5DC02_ACIBA|nr:MULTISPECIES: DUF1317 family protein [Acinetobacter]EHU2760888.1 DUF1317 family protein [Acinetobacter baumannii]EJB8489896.1 DUF1317 family protein [Acinetobacter baumannii]EKV7389856.1 DUF1317 family protein [Acinetobacter baumannii]EKW3202910.1 DUF1317 family protein [Acinetobacter baumannii]EKX0107488.1 DUF1317 family protein [Acinetobacter baumannii]